VPRCIVDEKDFRIVEDVVEGNEVFTLEVRDGCDALGVERWRTFQTRGIKNLEIIFNYFVRVAKQLDGMRGRTES
jgi:hypothetical protein